jgi:predicted  nucleic acid-binding Zn-ribbon protein
MNKADARKTVRDASAEVAKSDGDVAATGRKIAHDASQSGGQPVRKVVEATSRDMTRKNDAAAEQSLRKAAEDLRGTVRDASETAGDTADVVRQTSDQVVEQLAQVPATQEKAVKDVTGRTQQNLGVMMQTGVKLVDGYQAIMREWADYTRSAVQCNIDGMNSIMRARNPQDLIAAQSDLLNAEVRVLLNSGVRISEATLGLPSDWGSGCHGHL